MKRAIAGAVVVIVLIVAYRHFRAAAAVKVYEAFAEEILHRRYDSAAGMASGLSASDLARLGSQERIGAGPEMFQTLFPSQFRIETEEKKPDGTLEVVAIQTVLFNPAGVESAVRPAMYADLRQTVSLRNAEGEWKVAAFANTFERMGEYKAR
jgi:hypothetical protein